MPELPRFGSSREDTRPYEAKFTGTGRPIPLEEAEARDWVPPKEELQKYPKTVLLKIAIELNPDKVAESYQEGWTKEDILRIIEKHLSSSLGQTGTYGGEYIQDIEVLDSSVEE